MDEIQSLLRVDENGDTVLNLFLGGGDGHIDPLNPPPMSPREAEAYADAYDSNIGAGPAQGGDGCRRGPAAGDELRACGGCLVVRYCSDACQQ